MSEDDNKDSSHSEQPEEKEAPEKDSPIEPEVLDQLPADLKRKVVETAVSMQAFSAPVFHPVLKKITEAHIDKVLEQAEKDSERTFQDAQTSKKYSLAYVLIFAAVFVFLVVFLVGRNPDLLKDMVKYLAVFAGGYGFKAFMDWRGEE